MYHVGLLKIYLIPYCILYVIINNVKKLTHYHFNFLFQLEREYAGYDEKTPNEQVCTGNTSRAFALKYHTEFNHIFITGGWDNNIKVCLVCL